MGVGPQGAAILAGQAKVTDLEVPLVVVQDVGGLQVSVDDPIVMQILDTLQKLPHQCLDLQRRRNRSEGKGREGKGREGKGREGKGREGNGREGKGREGKGREGKRLQIVASIR